jgi:glycosyltransferase involved in cell wall biosynthesis
MLPVTKVQIGGRIKTRLKWETMRVLIVQTRYPPALGGQEKHVQQLVQHLNPAEYEVTVYTTSSLSSEDVCSFTVRPPFVLKPANTPDLPKEEVFKNTTVKRYRFKWRYWSLNWIPEMFKALKQTTADFDLVHAHGYHHTAALVSCHYAKKSQTPFILTAHDLTIASSLPADAQNIYTLYERTFGRYMIKNSAGLIALTDDQATQLVERGADPLKITIIPNGIELEKYEKQNTRDDAPLRYGLSQGDKVLLFVGRLIERKGIQDIVSILPQILEVYPETKLVITGEDYGYKRQLEDLVAHHNLDTNVTFTGTVSEQELRHLYRRANMFILPSRMEGFGITLLEAMASGTLCIAYSLPSVRRVIEDGVTGVLVKNKEGLLTSVLHYLDYPDQKTAIEQRALKSVKHYDIINVVKETEQVYRRCAR